MTKIPENSDATESPDELQETTYTCGECGVTFETAQKLGEHTHQCDGDDEGEDDG